MRLSYYGGGHYDSLVNDSDEFDPLADPGSRELLALQKARARKTNADASSALAVSDAEATERAAVEQALSASRAAYDGAADLEAVHGSAGEGEGVGSAAKARATAVMRAGW